MLFQIVKSYEYKYDDWSDWAVWIEGPDDELDKVEFVQYTLHHTFRKPVSRVYERENKFRLDTGGWGTFTIYAKVVRRDQTEERLEHELKLFYPSGEASPQ